MSYRQQILLTLGIFLFMLGLILFVVAPEDNEFEERCGNMGGIVVEDVCVDSSVILEVK